MTAGKQLSDGNPDGTGLGQSASDLIAFHGNTPTSQRTSTALSLTYSLLAMTGTSLIANTSTTVSGIFGFNSTMYGQLIDLLLEVRLILKDHGLTAGGAA